MTEQDTKHCAVCGNLLDVEPRLGEWIMHEKCRQSVARYMNDSALVKLAEVALSDYDADPVGYVECLFEAAQEYKEGQV